MAEPIEQSFANHRKLVPGFHFAALLTLVINFFWALFRLFRGGVLPLSDRVVSFLLAFGLLLLFLYIRQFPLRVQDRVIRLEEILRLRELLPADLQPRIGELTRGQLIALRFASDAELPELTRAVLAERITKQDDIKKRIRSWRADHLRA